MTSSPPHVSNGVKPASFLDVFHQAKAVDCILRHLHKDDGDCTCCIDLACLCREVSEDVVSSLWRRQDGLERLNTIYKAVKQELAIQDVQTCEDATNILQDSRFRRFADYVQHLHWDCPEDAGFLQEVCAALGSCTPAEQPTVLPNLRSLHWCDGRPQSMQFGHFLVSNAAGLESLTVIHSPGDDWEVFQNQASTLLEMAVLTAPETLSNIHIAESPSTTTSTTDIPLHAQRCLALEYAAAVAPQVYPDLRGMLLNISAHSGSGGPLRIRTLEVGVPLPRRVIQLLGHISSLKHLTLIADNTVDVFPLEPDVYDEDEIQGNPPSYSKVALFPALRTLNLSLLLPRSSDRELLDSLKSLRRRNQLEKLVIRILADPKQSITSTRMQQIFSALIAAAEDPVRTFVLHGVSEPRRTKEPPTLQLIGLPFKDHSWPSLTTMHIVHCALEVDDYFLYSLGCACPGLRDLRLCDRLATRKNTRTRATVEGVWIIAHWAANLETIWLAVNDDRWKVFASTPWGHPRALKCWNPLGSAISEEDVPYAVNAIPKLFPSLEEVTHWPTALTSGNLDGHCSVHEDAKGLDAEARKLAGRWKTVHEGLCLARAPKQEPVPQPRAHRLRAGIARMLGFH